MDIDHADTTTVFLNVSLEETTYLYGTTYGF